MVEKPRPEPGDVLRRDVSFALRSLARRPLFTTLVVLTLALGIGANTAIFSAVHAVLLRPLPVAGLDRMVVVYDDLPGINLQKAPLSPPEAVGLAARDDLFEVSAAYGSRGGEGMTLTGLGEPRRVNVTATLGRFFDLFGARPQLGRLYRAEESQPGKGQVAVLSHAFWQELTGGDRAIVGRKIDLDGNRYEVIGVLPPGFRFPRTSEVWVPLEVSPQVLEEWGRLYINFVGRMKPGLAHEQLASRLTAQATAWATNLPAEWRYTLVSEPFVDSLAGQLRPVLLMLMGAMSFVLLIACANVASLQLVRALGRAKEMAVRAALGAERWSIVRQLLTESLVLAMAGGMVGLVVGGWTVRGLSRWDAVRFEALQDLRLDPVVLAFTGGVTVLAAFLFGILPALRAARIDPQEVLKESARGASGGARQQRILQGSVVVQLALALVLLLGSALTIQSLARLLSTDPGFQAERVVTLNLSLPREGYSTWPARAAFFDSLLQRLGGMPEVEAAGAVFGLPFAGSGDSSPFDIKGLPKQPGEPERHANIRIIEGDYFRAMGIPLLQGRSFDATDVLPPASEQSPTVSAIIDESLAKKYFGEADPVGRVINQGPDAVVVGVVGAVRDEELGKEPYPTVYYAHRQRPIGEMSLVVRSNLDEAAVVGLARAAVGELDRNLPLYDAGPLRERVEGSLGTRRLAMAVLTGFAVLSLLVAALGVYGVMSYGVTQRTHEIGIRMALGARPGDVERMVLGTGLALAAMGAFVGTAVFLGLGRVLESLVYGVGPREPRTILAGVVLLALAAAFGSYWPARRAARVEPVEALRAE